MLNWMWWCTLVIPATWEAEVGGSQFKASPGKVSETLFQKQNVSKRVGVTPVIECFEAPGSIPNNTQKKELKRAS
jgi:hypothetical protein